MCGRWCDTERCGSCPCEDTCGSWLRRPRRCGREIGRLTSPPLSGRHDELDRIERHIEGEGPRLLLVVGEPGIGKSRLLHEGELHAHRYGFRVMHGMSRRQSGTRPFEPIADALAHHLQGHAPLQRRDIVRSLPWLVRLLPEYVDDLAEPLPALPPAGERRLIFDAVAEHLHTPHAADGIHTLGTLLLLDDLQWAGPDTLDLLTALARRSNGRGTGRAPLRILGAYRDTEAQADSLLSGMLADLAPGRLATELSLGPLLSLSQ